MIIPLLFGNLRLDELSVRDGLLHLVRRDSVTNIDFFLKRNPAADTADTDIGGTESLAAGTTSASTDIGALAHRLLTRALYRIPDNMEVRNFLLQIDDDSLKAEILAKEVRMVNEKMESTFVLNRDRKSTRLNSSQ